MRSLRRPSTYLRLERRFVGHGGAAEGEAELSAVEVVRRERRLLGRMRGGRLSRHGAWAAAKMEKRRAAPRRAIF